jgi:DNA invertase Pin-like site-specific DNA recombinase
MIAMANMGVRFIGYCRIHDPADQGPRARIAGLADIVFADEAPDPGAGRPHLREALDLAYTSLRDEHLRPVLVVVELADLGRSLVHLVSNLTAILDLHGSVLIVGAEPPEAIWTPEDDRDGQLAPILPAPLTVRQVSQRLNKARAAMASERVKRGQAKARQAGTAIGRRRALSGDQEEEVLRRMEHGEDPRRIAHDLGVSRNTVVRAAQRARTPHVTGENTARGKGTSSEPPEDANQLRRTSI